MTPDEQKQRSDEIDRELADLYEGKVTPGDPAAREAELLAEQDRIEFETGEE